MSILNSSLSKNSKSSLLHKLEVECIFKFSFFNSVKKSVDSIILFFKFNNLKSGNFSLDKPILLFSLKLEKEISWTIWNISSKIKFKSFKVKFIFQYWVKNFIEHSYLLSLYIISTFWAFSFENMGNEFFISS